MTNAASPISKVQLLRRLASTIVALGILFAAMYFDAATGQGWRFAALISIAAALAVREFYRLAADRGYAPFTAAGVVCAGVAAKRERGIRQPGADRAVDAVEFRLVEQSVFLPATAVGT